MPKRTGLTEQSVAEHALAIVDADGVDGLSMRKLAATLDVSPMTLYSYVADRDALLDLVAQLVYSRIAVPADTGDPRQTLRALMHAVRRVLLAHPNTLPLVAQHPPRTLAALGFVNAGYRALRQDGVAPLDTARAYRALAAYSLGTATVEVNRYFGPDRTTPPDDHTAALVRELPQQLPYVAEVGPLLDDLDDTAEFDYGLDLTLDGFMHRHRPG